MAVDPIARGRQAALLAQNPLLKDALDAATAWAQRAFTAASTPEEAWDARLRLQAAEEFTAYLLAVIHFGKAKVDELLAERDKMRKRKRDRETMVEYLDRARRERSKFSENEAEVA